MASEQKREAQMSSLGGNQGEKHNTFPGRYITGNKRRAEDAAQAARSCEVCLNACHVPEQLGT